MITVSVVVARNPLGPDSSYNADDGQPQRVAARGIVSLHRPVLYALHDGQLGAKETSTPATIMSDFAA
jgi:hypothetical protein